MTNSPPEVAGGSPQPQPQPVAAPRDLKMMADWIEEALTYVGSPSWSPSMVRDGNRILAAVNALSAPAVEPVAVMEATGFAGYLRCADPSPAAGPTRQGCLTPLYLSNN